MIKTTPLNKRNISILMLVIAACFWGSTFLFTKILIDDLEVYILLSGRSILAAIVLYIIYRKIIKAEFISVLKNLSLWFFAVAGFIALALQTEALKYTTATNSAFITALFVVFVPFIKFIMYRETVKKGFYIAVFIAILGLYLISIGFGLPHAFNKGDLLSLCCALFYAFYIILLEKLSVKYSEGSLMFFYFALQFIISFAIAMPTENISAIMHLNIFSYANLFALAVIGSVVPYLLMAKGQQNVKAQVASIIYNLEPVSATLLAYLFLGEMITETKVIGGIIIFIALTIGIKK
jgi:drug/metabolite transporter (DMT)-like permease